MKVTKSEIRELHRQNRDWPAALASVGEAHWPQLPGFGTGSVVKAVWRSQAFLVVEWLELNGYTRLSVMRTEYDPHTRCPRENVSWDDLQRLKAEAGYGDRCAVEVYPPDDQVVNVANMRHLFLLDDVPPFMWGASR